MSYENKSEKSYKGKVISVEKILRDNVSVRDLMGLYRYFSLLIRLYKTNNGQMISIKKLCRRSGTIIELSNTLEFLHQVMKKYPDMLEIKDEGDNHLILMKSSWKKKARDISLRLQNLDALEGNFIATI